MPEIGRVDVEREIPRSRLAEILRDLIFDFDAVRVAVERDARRVRERTRRDGAQGNARRARVFNGDAARAVAAEVI